LEGTLQTVEFDLYVDGGIDWYCPLVELLGKSYKKLLKKSGAYYCWTTPDCKFINPNTGLEEVIDTEKNYLKKDMATIIANSDSAKEVIREAFKIPPLPTSEEVEQVEAETKKRRKKKVVTELNKTL